MKHAPRVRTILSVLRKTIRTALAEGKTEEAAFQVIVDQYGPKILPEPPREGFSWMAWIMPFAALLLGGGMVSMVLWKWMKVNAEEEPAGDPATPSGVSDVPPEVPASVVEKYRAKINRQLEDEL